MAQFSSRPPFKQKAAKLGPFGMYVGDEDRPQRNPTNRALVHFRELHEKKSAALLANAAVHWSASLRDMRAAGAYTVAEEEHAREVLARLARFQGMGG